MGGTAKSPVEVRNLGARITVRGWAVDPLRKIPVEKVFVSINGKLFTTLYGVPREDVVQILGSQECLPSGFFLEIPASQFPTNLLHVSIVSLPRDSSSFANSQFGYVKIRK